MALRIKDRKKVILIKSSAKYGLNALASQIFLSFCDSFLRRRHLIYCAEKNDVLARESTRVAGLHFREVKEWGELRTEMQSYLLKNQEYLQWGDPSWFNRGWRLWVGEFGEDLATMSWWIPYKYANSFFITIPNDAEVMWQSTTIPKYRGRGLFTVHRVNLMKNRIENGINRFYVCCEEYNTTGKKNLPKQGFRFIGHHTRSKITGRTKWYPIRDRKHLP